jgi:predicted RNase H-like HicB family nuclease
MESNVNKYAISIVWSDSDQGYIATCPEFPGLSAFGETAEGALTEARVAIPLFIRTYEEDRLPIPEPRGLQRHSGQFRLRLPQSLHGQLAKMADAEGVSLNQFVLDALAERAGAQRVHNQMLQEMRRAIADLILQKSYLDQSANWSVTKLGPYEVEKTVTTAVSREKTAASRGITERGQ